MASTPPTPCERCGQYTGYEACNKIVPHNAPGTYIKVYYRGSLMHVPCEYGQDRIPWISSGHKDAPQPNTELPYGSSITATFVGKNIHVPCECGNVGVYAVRIKNGYAILGGCLAVTTEEESVGIHAEYIEKMRKNDRILDILNA